MGIQISAIICTLNRHGYLRMALQSLVDQTLARERYEILVVDNGSTDGTERMVRTEFGYMANLQYMREPILGLSHARNTGWLRAAGTFVAYLDDDAVACPRWLEKILDTFQMSSATLGCVGGKIDLTWEAPSPEWLAAELTSYLGRIDWSDHPCVLSETQWLGGGNIAFPRHLLMEIGGFQSRLGRVGTRLLSSEEILVRQQLEGRGYGCYYHPEIRVWHHVPASRLTKAWLRKRCYWQGVSNALLEKYRDTPSSRTWFISAGREITQLLTSPRRLIDLVRPAQEPSAFLRQCGEISRVGYVAGLLGLT